jgi:FtsP/CotA-like multicopper oxidase with cupredoxin domain
MAVSLRALLALPLLVACAGKPDPGDTAEVPTGPQACGSTPAPDLDPADGVVEVDLAASALQWDPGTGVPLTDGMAYEGQVPGPLIEADVGDTILAHFRNDLEMPLTVHWHGLRIDSDMDGGMAQMMDPVPPGGTFDYVFTPPDPGFYWYHPHLDGATTMERGLYGPIILHGEGEGRADCDLPLMLDDILLDVDTEQVAPADTDMMQLMGRLGNHLLANGREGREIAISRGQTVLLRLVNPSNARFWDVYLEGHDLQVVGTDGGWLATPYPVDHLVIVPGERYLVTFTAQGDPGGRYRLMNRRFQLHEEGGDMIEEDPLGDGDNPVLTFVYGPDEVDGTPWVQPPASPPSWTGPTETLGHHWQLDEDMMAGTVTIDGASWPDVPPVIVTGNIDTTFEVENLSEMHHPFHIHGNAYQVIAVDGEPLSTPPAWKDTWDVPPRSTVTVVSDLVNPGEWMYHCHILEHQEDGMMGMMEVE